MYNRSSRRWVDRGLTAVFLVVINLPFFSVLLDLDPQPMNRQRVPAWPRSIREVIKLPGAFSWFYNEGFGYRDAMIRAYSHFSLGWLNSSPLHRVTIGRNGWLFLTETLNGYRGVDAVSEDDLDAWRSLLAARGRVCQQEIQIPYLFMIAPDKATIYGDHLPAWVQRAGQTPLDRLIDHLDHHGSAQALIDPRPAIKIMSAINRTYHRSDTHWNDLGAYAGYLAVVEAVRRSGFEIQPLSNDQISVTVSNHPGGDLARMIAVKHQLPEELITLTPHDNRIVLDASGKPIRVVTIDVPASDQVETHCEQGEIESGIIFHDSFGVAMIPYLGRHFRTALFVRSDGFQAGLVRQRNPDIVIQQLVERRLTTLDPRTLDRDHD